MIDNYSMAVPVAATSYVAGTVGYLEKTHRGNGADITEEFSALAWGARQYVVREHNGYHLKIAESQESE
jgi:hypothetical protein